MVGLHVEFLKFGLLAEKTLAAGSARVGYCRCYYSACIQHLETRIWPASRGLYTDHNIALDCNELGGDRKTQWWQDAECEGILPQRERISGV